ncbi:MAG: cold shock domain-containing protein [Nanoarchaeota archaeon]|nr:cold shock domain-containing protein [Nanoarchaeota archaeon]MBU1644267.1 cold shock domain-containing protein [Nanoarchaeota archaeon]MBU1976991.1 cold shock domain-containing protein [Nanoarchaeota archaeon]
MEGKVKFFNVGKGFGFIQGDDGDDYFVHVSALQKGVFLRENDRVSFDSAQGDRGLKAENVKLVTGEKAPAEEESTEESAEESTEEPAEEPAEEKSADDKEKEE